MTVLPTAHAAPAAISTATTATAASRVEVLANNVMLLPELIGGIANSTRAGLLAGAPYLRGYDVLVLSEMFDNGPAATVTTGLSDDYPHQTPVLGRSRSGWDDTQGAFSLLTPEDGGVTVLSKWPIVRKVQYVYKQGCGADWFSNKGFVYAVLDVDGAKVHVVGSHTQAEDSLCSDAAAVRATQFAELDTFLDAQDIPPDEQVIIAGDLNVVKSSPEYDEMLTLTGTVAPTREAGAPYSWDPSTNSIAASRYAGYAPERLDYVLYRRANARPAVRTNTVLTPQSPPFTSGGTTYTDYSDHYPVTG
ncbi:sphingomyelin phosphodiesterase [Nocardioides sp. NPDC051685]|uniref:sphingomyelin phosphodiesterase n=1 Tax=Nocardioides sp. NPDC051685 TaxID=3364334 RepID=UPI0037926B04